MKKALALLLTLLLALSLAACNSSAPAADGQIEGSLEELLPKVAEGAADSEIALVTAEVNSDTFSWYFFIDPIEGAEGLVSEPMIGSIPHFIGLLRVPSSEDPEAVRASIEEKADPRKWVCTEAEKTAVVRHGDLILLAMSTADGVDKAVANFDALAK